MSACPLRRSFSDAPGLGLRSNPKPLKSSLKSPPSPPASYHTHLRARSEPPTPAKNVHFPETDHALATVRVFSRKARPAALSNPASGDETETEGEDTPPARFPLPTASYEIDPAKSSPVPCKTSPLANVYLESLSLSSSSSTGPSAKPSLTGALLVRNLAFEKHVAVRFTLDDWLTVSEVGARYVGSLPSLPSQIVPLLAVDAASQRARGWDRFAFTIRLEDYALCLSTRTIWLAARYRVTSAYPLPDSVQYGPGGEWWDNNQGSNYRISFRPAAKSPPSRLRRETVSGTVAPPPPSDGQCSLVSVGPVTPPRIQTPPPTASKEHALGLMIPTVSGNNQSMRSGPLRVGKLDLCNYAPPTVHATSSISFPSSDLPSGPPSLSSSPQLSSDEESASPASSTLSTPPVSPTITPRVIIGGHPAQPSELVHIPEWEWSAPNKAQIERIARQRADPAPASGMLPKPTRALSDNSLFDAFVTHWCFAHEPSLNHYGYDEGGIMA